VAGKKTWFVYSDEGLVAELDGSGREIRSFGWKPQGIWGTAPLYLKEAGHYYWYHNDHLGTPQMLTASSGAVVWEAKYESFGRAMVAGGARVKNPLRFPGQYEDEETGLHYNWMRYYDPATGRYLRGDPIGLEGGVNVYAYALNSPLNLIDPDGEIAFPVLFLIWRGVSLALTAYDLYQTAMIVMDPCSSAGDIGMAVAGLGIPGGGGVKKLGRASKSPIWSSTKNKTSVENAFGHFKKHGNEFPQYQNAKQYVEGANDFVRKPPSGAMTKTRANGEKVLYYPNSNTFAVQGTDGAPKTMFKPDPSTHGYPTNLDYYNAQ
jgi:RHS repeat-associated protein